MPFQSERLWDMLGEEDILNDLLWDDALNYSDNLYWNPNSPEPLFKRLDLDEIISHELSLANDINNDLSEDNTKGADYIEFDDFMKILTFVLRFSNFPCSEFHQILEQSNFYMSKYL